MSVYILSNLYIAMAHQITNNSSFAEAAKDILIQFGDFELRSLLDREILWGEFTDLQALSSGYLQHRCDRGGGV